MLYKLLSSPHTADFFNIIDWIGPWQFFRVIAIKVCQHCDKWLLSGCKTILAKINIIGEEIWNGGNDERFLTSILSLWQLQYHL